MPFPGQLARALALGAIAALATIAAPPATFAASAATEADPPTVSVLDYGANPGGAEAESTTAAFAAAFAANPNGRIVVPAGYYLIANESGALLVRDFSGALEFESGAWLIFTDNTRGGLWFEGGAGARITGLRATYQTPPERRASPEEQIKFSSTVDTVLTDTIVTNSPAAGILFFSSIRPRVSNATIWDSLADGLHFANCQDSQADAITAINTGDDGLAFVNYAEYEDRTGGTASNIYVLNSHARGIAVAGQSGVTISDFFIDGTSSSGLLCAEDPSYRTRVPANVTFTGGTVANAGAFGDPAGNNYGIEYDNASSCRFAFIDVISPAGRGLAGMAPSGSIAVDHVTVRHNGDGEGFSFFRTANVAVSASTAEDSPSYGFYFAECESVAAASITAIDTARAGELRRAIWFENNHSVQASGLTVADDQAISTGYVVGAHQSGGVVQAGLIDGITARITNGTLQVQNNSRALVIRLLTTAH